jgi:hypothetical protein
MEYILQLSKKKSVTIWQRFGLVVLFVVYLSDMAFQGINRYFGIHSKSDMIWAGSFLGFCGLAFLFCLMMNKF